jgi:two-component system LytT family response regulator
VIRILIVDDEANARSKVKRFLSAHEDCECVGEAADGRRAASQIAALQPDLVFLDINMPECDGFEALALLPDGARPHVIFATAYDDRAVQAFEVQALDYLLKPFDRTRFDAALDRARQRIHQHREEENPSQHIFEQLRTLLPERQYPKQLLVQDGGNIQVVALKNVEYVESAANYVILHCSKRQHMMRTTLVQLEKQLDPKAFCRVHRQYLVRVEAIRELTPWAKGDMQIRLSSGTTIKLSRNYRDQLMQVFHF